jgi:hypothetical protein
MQIRETKAPSVSLGPFLCLALAENWFPSFEWFVVSGFPVGQYRRDPEARLKIEGERSFVLKPDVNGAIVRGQRQFHVSNDLAFGLWKTENAPIGNFLSSTGAGSFMGSHVAS